MAPDSRSNIAVFFQILLLFALSLPSLFAETAAQEKSQDPNSSASEQPEKRIDIWIERRLEKMKHTEAEELPTAEKLFLWIEEQIAEVLTFPTLSDTEDFLGFDNPRMSDVIGIDYRDHLYPQVGSIQIGSGLSPGIRYRDPQIGHSDIGFEVSGAASFTRYQTYRFLFGKLPWTRFVPELATGGLKEEQRFFFLYSDVRYDYFPEEDFFGLGSNSLKENRSDFLLERANYSLVGGIRFNKEITAALRTGLSQIDNGPGGDGRFTNTDLLFDESAAPGLNLQDDFFELGTSLLLDYRDVPGNPHQGVFLGFAFHRFDDLRRQRFEFNRFRLDARGYISLGSPQRVIALQFLTSLDDADNGARVPFYLQNTLGGSSTLRGFSNRRFRGEDFLHFSAEYRWEAASAVELAVFYDAGKVIGESEKYNFEALEKSLGFGLRFKTSDTAFLRMDVARSDEETRFHFTLGHPF